MVPNRRTDRRRFSSWPVPAGSLNLLMRRASRASVLLVPVTEPAIRGHLVRTLTEAGIRQANSPGYDTEPARWTGRRNRTQRGGPGRQRPGGIGVARRPADATVHPRNTQRVLSGGWAGRRWCSPPPDDDPRSRLRAGEAASIVLLTATDMMLASCPLSQAWEIADTRSTIHIHDAFQ